jgi:CheY-like chemotaxis protein
MPYHESRNIIKDGIESKVGAQIDTSERFCSRCVTRRSPKGDGGEASLSPQFCPIHRFSLSASVKIPAKSAGWRFVLDSAPCLLRRISYAMEKRLRVLIVDDDETFCQLLAEVLGGRGIEVVWTTDGLEGYEMSLYERYDLFILDQRMPLILGSELVEEIKKDNPKAKIILTSAFADEALQNRSQRLGVPLLSKPFSANRLLEAVETVVGRLKHGEN